MSSHDKKKWLAAFSALVVLGSGGVALAQEDSAPAAEQPAAAAPAAPAEAPKPIVKPRPSEMMPLAARAMMLDVVNTGDHLLAVGEHGIIVVSNNGRQWAQVQTPIRSPLTAASFANNMDGWVVGHDATILHTVDGGKTWELQNFKPDLEKPYLDVLALDANNAVAVGAYGLISRTSDAGKTWSNIDAPTIREGELHFNCLTKLSDGSLLVVGEQGTMGLSTDAGVTWKKLTSPYDGSYFGAVPYGPKGALVYGLRGNIYESHDLASGKWDKIDPGTVATFYGGNVMPNGDLVMVGSNGEIKLISATTNAVSTQKVTHIVVDANGTEKNDVVTSTLTAAVPFGDGLVLVGEQGIQQLAKLQ
jgi:photosystem II stability/assembly factor-like uncharacterized protein